MFQNTSLSAVINPAGWSVWSASDVNTEFVYFREFKNTGTGASGTRVCLHVQPSTIGCRFANLITFYLIGRVFRFLGRSRTHYNVVWIFVHQLGGYFIFVVSFGANDTQCSSSSSGSGLYSTQKTNYLLYQNIPAITPINWTYLL